MQPLYYFLKYLKTSIPREYIVILKKKLKVNVQFFQKTSKTFI